MCSSVVLRALFVHCDGFSWVLVASHVFLCVSSESAVTEAGGCVTTNVSSVCREQTGEFGLKSDIRQFLMAGASTSILSLTGGVMLNETSQYLISCPETWH